MNVKHKNSVIKRVSALFITVLMLLSVGSVAFATGGGTATLILDGGDEDTVTCTKADDCAAQEHDPTCPKYAPPVVTCDGTADCAAESHNEGCLSQQGGNTPVTCTKAEDCAAESHEDGCPKGAAPVVCTKAEGCPAEEHEDGCPHKPVVTNTTCTEGLDCTADTHEEFCLSQCICTERCSNKSDVCPVCSTLDTFGNLCMACTCQVKCDGSASVGCNLCTKDHSRCKATCTYSAGCTSENHAAGCPALGCVCPEGGARCTEESHYEGCAVCAADAAACRVVEGPKFNVTEKSNFTIGGVPMDAGAEYRTYETGDQANANGYGSWTAEFYLTFYGFEGTVDLKGCGLGGDIQPFDPQAFIIPDSYLLSSDNPTVGIIGLLASLQNWENFAVPWSTVCAFSDNGANAFICGININDEIFLQYPEFGVKLDLKLTNPQNPTEVLTLSTLDYDIRDLTEDGMVKDSDGYFVINNLDDLKYFRDQVNAGNADFVSANVKLGASIDMSSVTNWEPIAGFKGTFDGNGKTLSNLTINDPDGKYIGLFSAVGEGGGMTIKNLTVNNANITAGENVGVIVGSNTHTTVENCHVSGLIKVTANKYAGGITGGGYGSITGCSVKGASGSYITANVDGNAGGIVGFLREGPYAIRDCVVEGLTIEACRSVGGIIGRGYLNNTVTGCRVSGCTLKLTASESYAAAEAKYMAIGGIVGSYVVYNDNKTGGLSSCSVSNLSYVNVNGVAASVGPITGGFSSVPATEPEIAHSGNTASGIMGGIENNAYLTSYGARIGGTYYSSISAAVDDAADGDTVVAMADQTIDSTVVINKSITLDLGGKTVTGGTDVMPVFRITDGASVTVKNGSITNNDGYCFILGASDGSSIGNLTIEGGTYHGDTSVASVTKGTLTVTGGEFSVTPYQGSYAYLFNCIDDNYRNGTAKIVIKGGTFHNWNPSDNAAEGADTCFVPEELAAKEGSAADSFVITTAVASVDGRGYTSLAAAIADNNTNTSLEVTLLGTAKLTEIANLGSVKSLTIKGADRTKAIMDICDQEIYTVAGLTVTFDNVTVNGHTVWSYKGFRGSPAKESYLNCLINGTLTVHADEVYVYNCDFKSDATNGDGDYSLFTYGVDNLKVEACDFDVYERAIKLYSESVGLSTAVITGCTFTSATKDKAAVEINPPWTTTKFDVTITNCTATGFGGAEHNGDADNALWNYEECPSAVDQPTGTVTVDGVKVYPAPVAQINGVGYDSIAAALDEARNGDTIVVLKDHSISATVIVNKNVTIDLNGKTVTAMANVMPMFRIVADVTFTDSSNGSGKLDGVTDPGDSYCFILGASDGSASGNLTIEGGSYYGSTTVASVTKGTLTVTGGDFSVTPYQGSYAYLFNCIDDNYRNGTAKITVTGGTFYNFDPNNNAAEGTGTDFVPDTHYSESGDTAALWTVSKKIALTVTVHDVSSTQGQPVPNLTGDVVGLVDGDTVNVIYTTEGDSSAPAGTYEITATVSGADAYKYALSVTKGTLTITKPVVVITVDDVTVTYGDAIPAFTGTVAMADGGAAPSDITVSYDGPANVSDAGEYEDAIIATVSGNGADRYEYQITKGTLTIAPKEVSVVVKNATKTYGEDDPDFEATVVDLVPGDTATLTYTREPGEDVGEYAISADVDSDNYKVVRADEGTLTIGRKSATVTVDDKLVTVGDDMPELTYTATGFFAEDDITVTLSTTAKNTETAGEYDITATVTGDDAGNYSVASSLGTLTVSAKPIVVITADDLTKTYGDKDPELTGSAVIEGSDKIPVGITITYSRASGENVGEYDITAAVTGAGAQNYEYKVVFGTLTIAPKAVTVKADNVTVKMGDDMPTLTSTTSGLVSGDTLDVTLTTAAKDTKTPGTYVITVSVKENDNYTITAENGVLTVTDLNLDTNGDGKADENIDGNNDGTPEYSVIKGINGKYTKGVSSALKFTGNGTFNRFVGVKVDGKTLDAKHYTAVSGSTIVTLKTSFLNTLSTGKHTMTIVYTDGEASCNFYIQTDPDNPYTGDNSSVGLWLSLIAASGAVIGATVFTARKKGKHSR